MWSCVAIVSFGAALLAGCATTPATDATQLYGLGQHLTRSVCPGPPTSVVSLPNKHVAGYIDRIEARICSKGSSELYLGELASKPQGLAMSVEITAPNAGLPHWLEIGQPLSRAVRVLGVPQERDAESITYPITWDSDDSLIISAKKGRIASVRWSWAVD